VTGRRIDMAWKTIGTVPGLAMAMGVMCAAVAFAPGMSAAQAKAKQAKDSDPSKTVCQTIMPSGTRLGKRVCRTQQEWNDQARAAQDSLLEHQRANTTTNINPN
jgi:hypothetical protein